MNFTVCCLDNIIPSQSLKILTKNEFIIFVAAAFSCFLNFSVVMNLMNQLFMFIPMLLFQVITSLHENIEVCLFLLNSCFFTYLMILWGDH